MSESGGLPVWVKLLIVVGALFAMVGGCSVLLGNFAMKGTKEVAAQAEAFAKATDQQGCLDEAVVRVKACGDGTLCFIKVSAWEAICLTESAPTPGFCDGIPKASKKPEAMAWYETACPAIDLPNDDSCHVVRGVQQGMCHDPSMNKVAADPAGG